MEEDDILDTTQISWEGDFEAQVQTVLRHVRLTAEEVINIRTLYVDLEKALNPHAPGCQVFPFGSVVTGLGIKTSDVDCYVKLPSHIEPTKQSVIYARNILRRYSNIFTNLFAISQAAVPIVKFLHIPTNFNCDVNFKSPSGVHNSNLIGFMLHLDSRALPLAVLIKYYSKVYKFTGTNLMPNYALTMMVIFYLQQVKILPPVWELQERVTPVMVDGWNNAYDKSFCRDNNNKDCLYLLMGGFFTYYTHFNYDDVISPYLGRLINKKAFSSLSTVPDVFKVYKHNVGSKFCKPLRVDSKICVQDPFQHNRNCSMAVYPKLANKINEHFKFAFEKFRDLTSECFLKAIFVDDQSPVITKKKNNVNNQKQRPVFHNKVKKHTQKPKGHGIQNQFNQWFAQTNRRRGPIHK